ncbi:unnamed protein product [Protopolystoma xenopodis]|uniref:Uncharacterized protein n=1 Tax=Protopolystoma xenopodis TaxID=117903 RepID=A0A3S5AK76_9PLAT|nr:unnamed protein product [Protopolystoma xenopodis]
MLLFVPSHEARTTDTWPNLAQSAGHSRHFGRISRFQRFNRIADLTFISSPGVFRRDSSLNPTKIPPWPPFCRISDGPLGSLFTCIVDLCVCVWVHQHMTETRRCEDASHVGSTESCPLLGCGEVSSRNSAQTLHNSIESLGTTSPTSTPALSTPLYFPRPQHSRSSADLFSQFYHFSPQQRTIGDILSTHYRSRQQVRSVKRRRPEYM